MVGSYLEQLKDRLKVVIVASESGEAKRANAKRFDAIRRTYVHF